MSEEATRRLMTVDVGMPQWRAALIETVILGSMMGGRNAGIRRKRAEAVADQVLDLIKQTGEDLEPLLDEMARRTVEAEVASQQSEGRVARVEQMLGLAETVPGEVVAGR